jgi:hypothetical protein
LQSLLIRFSTAVVLAAASGMGLAHEHYRFATS